MTDSDWMKFPKRVMRVTADEARRILSGEKAVKRGRYGIRTAANAAVRQVDGHTFDSGLEVLRYGDLKRRATAGEITDLRVHPCLLYTSPSPRDA